MSFLPNSYLPFTYSYFLPSFHSYTFCTSLLPHYFSLIIPVLTLLSYLFHSLSQSNTHSPSSPLIDSLPHSFTFILLSYLASYPFSLPLSPSIFLSYRQEVPPSLLATYSCPYSPSPSLSLTQSHLYSCTLTIFLTLRHNVRGLLSRRIQVSLIFINTNIQYSTFTLNHII
jgi:hypothetical protein